MVITVSSVKACKEMCLVLTLVHVSLSSADGWLLDITKLKLGENIGEGEFGGELSLNWFAAF